MVVILGNGFDFYLFELKLNFDDVKVWRDYCLIKINLDNLKKKLMFFERNKIILFL